MHYRAGKIYSFTFSKTFIKISDLLFMKRKLSVGGLSINNGIVLYKNLVLVKNLIVLCLQDAVMKKS